jgi:hypothetical protein
LPIVHPPRVDLSAPRFVRRYGTAARFRVRDVHEDYRVKLDAHYVARSIRPDGRKDTPRNFGYGLAEVDAGLADTLRILNAHGYPTMASCSGLLVDHPGTKEGAEYGYVLLFRMESKREHAVFKAAKVAGIIAEPRTPGSYARGIRLGTGIMRDGSQERPDRQAIREYREKHGLAMRWVERRVREIVAQHGGWIDDAAVTALWARFTKALTGERAVVF